MRPIQCCLQPPQSLSSRFLKKKQRDAALVFTSTKQSPREGPDSLSGVARWVGRLCCGRAESWYYLRCHLGSNDVVFGYIHVGGRTKSQPAASWGL